jgi:phospholipid/cholesterol/gamma-HCH transport system substrate-binding protein
MISFTTKIQLIVFAMITLIGCSFVGAKYAHLDDYVVDDEYTVTATFGKSGGIFEGAEVTYRGVSVGRVEAMRLVPGGVDVVMDISDDTDSIPNDVRAVVANRSAVGEQYVDLQPIRNGEPFLADGAHIPDSRTATPLPTTELLTNLNDLVMSVNRDNLRTVVSEMGDAFRGTGQEMGRIIDTSNSFIETADNHFDLTSRLIRDGRTVLQTQIDSASAIRTFSTNLARLSDTLVRHDDDIRRVIDNGGEAARVMRSFIRDNRASLTQMFSNFVTNGEITVARLHGLEQVLVLYPYVVEGGYTVVAKDPVTGLYDAHFGMVLTNEPHVCTHGYETTEQRPPQDLSEVPFNTAAHCAEPAGTSNARGAQHAPEPLAHPLNRPAPAPLSAAPVVATYDPATGRLVPAKEAPMPDAVSGGDGATTLRQEDSWRWLLLGALAEGR